MQKGLLEKLCDSLEMRFGGDSEAVKERMWQEFTEGQHGGPSVMVLVVAARSGHLEDTLKSYPAPLRELFADLLKDIKKDIKKDVVPVVSISDIGHA